MPDRSPRKDSPLRKARKARNWTLERTVDEIDLCTPGGHSGVTPSMLSGWELGRHVTSIGHRSTLCEIFGQSPDVLFAHQDEQLTSAGGDSAPRLLAGWDALQSAMLATVTEARECLTVMGSRSRDRTYLETIETVLAERPALVCYRVLFGPPHHQVLKDHLMTLLQLRDPGDRSLGVKTLHLGLVEDVTASPERFFCASERMAVVPLPSLTSHEAFDCGVVLGETAALRLLEHGRQAYAAARKVETAQSVAGLGVLREGSRRA